MAKRRRGYPSETVVKRGVRVVHGDKELHEKLGRRDLCPCGSGRRFQCLLPFNETLRRRFARRLFPALMKKPRRTRVRRGLCRVLYRSQVQCSCSQVTSLFDAGAYAPSSDSVGVAWKERPYTMLRNSPKVSVPLSSQT